MLHVSDDDSAPAVRKIYDAVVAVDGPPTTSFDSRLRCKDDYLMRLKIDIAQGRRVNQSLEAVGIAGDLDAIDIAPARRAPLAQADANGAARLNRVSLG